MRLSTHQRRVLLALITLEQCHAWSWWSRDAIGCVVAAGGFHQVIQIKTIAILKSAGLVQTLWSSWSSDMRRQVGCGCARWKWGLTDAGRVEALKLRSNFDDATIKRVADLHWAAGAQEHWGDEDEWGWGGDDDDDDGPDDCSPAPIIPGDLCLA